MNTLKSTRKKRIAIGVCCLLAGALVAGWSIGRYIPGTPRDAKSTSAPMERFSPYLTTVDADTIIEIPFDSERLLEGLTHGCKYTTGEESLTRMSDEDIRKSIDAGIWEYDCSDITVKVAGNRVVSISAFEEWYPHFAEAYSWHTWDETSRVVLVEMVFPNKSETNAQIPPFTLWSEKFQMAPATKAGSGWMLEDNILEEFYGVPKDGFVAYRLEDDWNVIGPGETKTLVLPYIVPTNLIERGQQSGTYDLSDFYVTAWDCNPAIVYRFLLV